MRKIYLVFISSAQDEAKTERRELIRIVSELGAIPVTADTFDITLEEDRRIIRRFIEECDYFVNLTAHSGGKPADGRLALELEYSCAVKADVPVLSLLIGEKARRKAPKKGADPASANALAAFKKKLETHAHDTWTNMADFKQKALALLSREMNLVPRRGWVPSDEASIPLVANELSRLIRENDRLRRKIKMRETGFTARIKTRVKQTLNILAANGISLSFYYVDSDNWENSRSFRYIRLFRLLAPELSSPKTAAEISHFFGNILNPDLQKLVRRDYPTPSNTINKVMSDFATLKLVTGNSGSWEMTEFGGAAFSVLRHRQMNRRREARKNSTKP